ncbi:hypothetical protein TNCV_150421 [Trichonephila clavipes]|nr:hypothetical protein TNCV_150421 [Trichonephila clavipes]
MFFRCPHKNIINARSIGRSECQGTVPPSPKRGFQVRAHIAVKFRDSAFFDEEIERYAFVAHLSRYHLHGKTLHVCFFDLGKVSHRRRQNNCE